MSGWPGAILHTKISQTSIDHDDVIKWRHFPRNWPFVWGIRPVNSPHKWPVTRSFDVFFDLRLNKRFSKPSWGWWFETLSRPLWRHRNGYMGHSFIWNNGMRLLIHAIISTMVWINPFEVRTSKSTYIPHKTINVIIYPRPFSNKHLIAPHIKCRSSWQFKQFAAFLSNDNGKAKMPKNV